MFLEVFLYIDFAFFQGNDDSVTVSMPRPLATDRHCLTFVQVRLVVSMSVSVRNKIDGKHQFLQNR